MPDGQRVTSAHGILEVASVLSETFQSKAKELFRTYYPIEIDEKMNKGSPGAQVPLMHDWYGQVHELIIKEFVTRDNIAGAVSGCKTIRLRNGMLDFLHSCQTHDPVIPVSLVPIAFSFSAPTEMSQPLDHDSRIIMSAGMIFDESGRLTDFSEPLLHIFSKQVSRFVGFLNEKVDERLPEFKRKFDIVVTDDGVVPEVAFRAVHSALLFGNSIIVQQLLLLLKQMLFAWRLKIVVLGVLWSSAFGSRSLALKGKQIEFDSEELSIEESIQQNQSLLLSKPSALCIICRDENSCTERGLTCLQCPVCGAFVQKIEAEAKSPGCPSSCKAELCGPLSEFCGAKRCPTLCPKRGKKKKSVWKPVKDLMAELENLVGLGAVKDQMKEIVAQVDFNLQRESLKLPDIGGQSLHMSFLGNPGTGKTVVARIVGELLVAMGAIRGNATEGEGFELVSEVSRPDLVGEHSGSTALKVTQAFDDADGGVLFIDEAYSIVQGDGDSFGKEAVDTIIKLMEDRRDRIIVILAGYQKEMSDFVAANPGFKSRIAFSFNFPDYSCTELTKIADRLLKKRNVALAEGSGSETCESRTPPESCSWLKNSIRLQTGCCESPPCSKQENRANGNGRTVRNILEASYREMASRVLTSFTPQLLEDYDGHLVLRNFLTVHCWMLDAPGQSFTISI
eukprot:Skav225323  [mRNA]  locus=scaffold891:203532:215947:- [translate_table: standard]